MRINIYPDQFWNVWDPKDINRLIIYRKEEVRNKLETNLNRIYTLRKQMAKQKEISTRIRWSAR